jgi:hypothetical protein
LTTGFPLTYEPGNAAQQVIRPGVLETDTSHTFSVVTLGRDVGKLKKGDRVWVVSDGDSLTPSQTASGGQPVFGDVVKPSTPIAISAGDSIGHMGFYQLPEENGKRSRYQVHIECLSMDDKLPTFLTNYALGELGFVTLDKAPESFDLIDGIKHPDNVVKGILEQMYKAAQDETRTSHALNEYNYKRLLDRIDSNKDGHYSEKEYLDAIQNVSYRDSLYRIIAKHGSEWYYGKEDLLWKTYLDTLTNDAPLWKTYTETFIDKMAWMKDVPGMGPEPWHMHPVVFFDAIKSSSKWFDIEKFIQKYKEKHSVVFGFYDRGNKITIPVLTQDSEESLRKLLNEMKKQYYNYFDDFNEKFVSYMLATIRIESYAYRQRLFFKPISEDISYDKAEVDYGSGPTASDRRRAILNHNTNIGDGYKYRGRGLVQLTWKINYKKFKSITGIDIVTSPELCLEVSTAVSIMMKGMRDGGFRPEHTLELYLGEGKRDYFNARLIINGYRHGIPDKADEFEDYAELFEVIINETI